VAYDFKIDFSFGIVTGGGYDERICAIIASREALKIPNYEVLLVGATDLSGKNS
jgi:hypothetical protein